MFLIGWHKGLPVCQLQCPKRLLFQKSFPDSWPGVTPGKLVHCARAKTYCILRCWTMSSWCSFYISMSDLYIIYLHCEQCIAYSFIYATSTPLWYHNFLFLDEYTLNSKCFEVKVGMHQISALSRLLLVTCRSNGCTVVSGIVSIIVVVGGICNCSQMTTIKCTCLNFGVSNEYRSWPWLETHKRNFW